MVASGARYLAFTGRSAPSAKAEKVLKDLRANGATILIERVDVSNSGQIASLIGKIKRTMPPLRGIMHLAATFKHVALMQLSLENFKEAMAPKAVGAWNLHSLTLDEPLDFFVLFSSAASLLGSPMPAHYVAANAFLDTLAHYRRSLGLPALSLNWGAWARAGAASGEFGKLLAERGLYTITLKHGLLALKKCMRQELTQIACMNLNAERWTQYFAAGSRDMLFTHLIGEQDQIGNGNGHTPSLKASLLAEPRMASRKAMIESFLKEHLAKVLRTSPERIDSTSPLSRQGLDSLMSIEFRHRLESQLRIALTPLFTWKYPTVTSMVHHLAEKMNIPIEMESANSSPQTLETELIRAQLQQLSESELGAKLAARLQALNEV
jgi:acyl carrier protein